MFIESDARQSIIGEPTNKWVVMNAPFSTHSAIDDVCKIFINEIKQSSSCKMPNFLYQLPTVSPMIGKIYSLTKSSNSQATCQAPVGHNYLFDRI
jgi:hypothetical protein